MKRWNITVYALDMDEDGFQDSPRAITTLWDVSSPCSEREICDAACKQYDGDYAVATEVVTG